MSTEQPGLFEELNQSPKQYLRRLVIKLLAAMEPFAGAGAGDAYPEIDDHRQLLETALCQRCRLRGTQAGSFC